KLIEDGAERLGISIIKTAVKDAAKYSEDIGVYDRVLCDVPCSGIGVIRRKPEIRYKTKEEIDSLVPIQKSILNTASMYVKQGGTLLYSTCTLNFEENGAVTQEFLKNHPDFTIEPLFDGSDASEKTFLPSSDKTDGFYICKFKKIR
ncbi:MAG: 16S rRNA (cytosine(967)-C(5))-methyltransferase RsmB, partial [Acutalibacteraceae bacterium]